MKRNEYKSGAITLLIILLLQIIFIIYVWPFLTEAIK